MKTVHARRTRQIFAAQRGFSVIELVVAMTIAVFLLAGLFTILQGTRHTSSDQTALAQLQDNERIAMSVMTDIVQAAGYYPGAPTAVLTTELPVTGQFATAGQAVAGTDNGAQGVNLLIRFETANNDRIYNCFGANTTGAVQVYVNTFSVNANNQLTCSNGVTTAAIANGVQSMVVRYAVNTSSASANSNCPADRYLLTSEMTTAIYWTNVCAVEVKLTFINPLYQPVPGGPTTPGQNPTVVFTRLIGIMSKSGVNSVTVI
ncbi:MAG TPA: prepilin-type N-terminal cleavage/methylation domain-containing protein [Steroidobacteraceae bacterium]|jgi:type IV pilus assembly protein PilW|nr:prepilin-type N-terminal cleavage/methylation domain-containing protein [Steroidobacteraceae bacterium]